MAQSVNQIIQAALTPPQNDNSDAATFMRWLNPQQRSALAQVATTVINNNSHLVRNGNHGELARLVTEELTRNPQTRPILIAYARTQTGSFLYTDEGLIPIISGRLQPGIATMLSNHNSALASAVALGSPSAERFLASAQDLGRLSSPTFPGKTGGDGGVHL